MGSWSCSPRRRRRCRARSGCSRASNATTAPMRSRSACGSGCGGEVTAEDDDYFGDPVIEAARLCAACEAGHILAADVVRTMAGRRILAASAERDDQFAADHDAASAERLRIPSLSYTCDKCVLTVSAPMNSASPI